MKQLIEDLISAMEYHVEQTRPVHMTTVAIQAAKDALKAMPAAQPAPLQEPVAWMHWLHGPVQLFMNKQEAMMELDRLNREYPVDNHARKMRPLVFGDTTPPAQRQWVGLTQQDIDIAFDDTQEGGGFDEFARAIEAKLKEKNNG